MCEKIYKNIFFTRAFVRKCSMLTTNEQQNWLRNFPEYIFDIQPRVNCNNKNSARAEQRVMIWWWIRMVDRNGWNDNEKSLRCSCRCKIIDFSLVIELSASSDIRWKASHTEANARVVDGVSLAYTAPEYTATCVSAGGWLAAGKCGLFDGRCGASIHAL